MLLSTQSQTILNNKTIKRTKSVTVIRKTNVIVRNSVCKTELENRYFKKCDAGCNL